MSNVQYTLRAFRDDHIGSISEKIVGDTDHRAEADEMAHQWGLGPFVKETINGAYFYEDGEIITAFQIIPEPTK